MVRTGFGKYTYEWVEGWGKLPYGYTIGQTGIAVDSEDRVYAFNRSDHPLIVFDREGNFLTSWGEGVLVDAHGMHIDEDDNLYLAVKDAHVVMKYDKKGNQLMTMGTRDQPSDTGIAHGAGMGQPDWNRKQEPVPRASGPFNMPTDLSIAPNGDLYISDGYANARVHVFSPDGGLKFSWGQPGKFGPGEFYTPHGIWVDNVNERVYVADRENDRIQIFDLQGNILDVWNGFRRPCTVHIDEDGTLFVPELRAFVTICDKDGKVFTRLDGPYGNWPQGASAHFLFVDRHGDIYINTFLDDPTHRDKDFVRTGTRLVKYRRVGS